MLALSLYVGLGFFFGVNAVALLSGVSVVTAMARGVAALALFVALGAAASVAVRVKAAPVESSDD